MRKSYIVEQIKDANAFFLTMNIENKSDLFGKFSFAFGLIEEQGEHIFYVLCGGNIYYVEIRRSDKVIIELKKFETRQEFIEKFPYMAKQLDIAYEMLSTKTR